MITLTGGAHHAEQRLSISSGSIQSQQLKITQQIQLTETAVQSRHSVCYPQAEERLSVSVMSGKLITHLISITSLLLSSYFSFHSDTSLSLATI